MRYFPEALTRQASDRMAARADEGLERQGWGIWALEQRATGRFLGFTGLARPAFEAPFTPAVELGWRLARGAWGFGFVTEAARAAAAFAFDELDVDELVSYTSEPNIRSRAVMIRLGMRRCDMTPPKTSITRRHVLYRQTATQLDASLLRPS